ncbi:hypothetical protein H1C71_011979, partial [Ictidomys tridecemlineatus]
WRKQNLQKQEHILQRSGFGGQRGLKVQKLARLGEGGSRLGTAHPLQNIPGGGPAAGVLTNAGAREAPAGWISAGRGSPRHTTNTEGGGSSGRPEPESPAGGQGRGAAPGPKLNPQMGLQSVAPREQRA